MRRRTPDRLLGLVILATVLAAALLHRGAVTTLVPPADAADSGRAFVVGPDPRDIPGLIASVFGREAGVAQCIAGAESGWQVDALAVNPDGSRDRGVFQINSRWHAGVTDAEAFDAPTNIRVAYALSHGGTDWSAWSDATRERCGLPAD